MTSQQYVNNIYSAMCANGENLRSLYEGKIGALRLAREIGYGFNDSLREGESYKSVLNTIQGTYSSLCVRFYNLKPPIDAKEWVQEMLSQIKEQYKIAG